MAERNCTIWWRACIAFLVIMLVSACASVPEREFKAYRDAFELSKAAGQEVILDFSVAKADQEKRAAQAKAPKSAASAQPALYQFNYKLTTGAGALKPADPAQARLHAFEVIGGYNQVLTELAEGKSADQVAASAGQLVQALSSAISIAPGVGPLVADFAAAIERARVRAEFLEALQKGEPVIVKIIDVLLADIPDFYDLRRTLMLQDLLAIEERVDQRATTLEKAALALDPAAQVDLAAYESRINANLGQLVGMDRRLRLARGTKAGPQSSLAQATLTNAVLEDARIAFAADVSAYLAATSRLNTYYAMLQHYEAMLAGTRAAASTLRLAVDAPQNAASQIQELLQTALLLRRDFIQIRTPA